MVNFRSLLPYFFALLVIIILLYTGIIENAIDLISRNNIKYEYLLLFTLVFTGAQILRAYRLKLLLNLDEISILYFIRIIYLSWFMNALFPARLGEVSQIYMLKKEGVSTTKATVAILLDKTIDLLTLIILLFVLLNIVNYNHDLSNNLNYILFFYLGIIIIAIIGFFFILIYKNPTVVIALVTKILPDSALTKKLVKLIQNVNFSLKELAANPSRFMKIALLASGVWLLEMSTTFIIASSLNIEIHPDIAFLAQIITFGSMIIPLTPGGIGTYEGTLGLVLATLTNHDLSETTLPLATIEHTLRQIYTIIFGLISLYSMDRYEFKDFVNKPDNAYHNDDNQLA